MKEITLRKTHRNLGIFFGLFLLLQGGSGLLLSIGELFAPATNAVEREAHSQASAGRDSHSEPGVTETHREHPPDRQDKRHGRLGQLHHAEGPLWNLYRIVVGTGLLAMLTSGAAIFLKGRGRNPPKPPQ